MTVKITNIGVSMLNKLEATPRSAVLTAARALAGSTDRDQQIHLPGRQGGYRLRRVDGRWGILYQTAEAASRNVEPGDIIVLVLIDLQEIAGLSEYWVGGPLRRPTWGWWPRTKSAQFGAALIDQILLGNLWLEMADLGVCGA